MTSLIVDETKSVTEITSLSPGLLQTKMAIFWNLYRVPALGGQPLDIKRHDTALNRMIRFAIWRMRPPYYTFTAN